MGMEDRQGKLPLHYACQAGDPYDIVDFLLRKFPDGAQHCDRDGLLPLHVAAHNPNPEAKDLVDILLCVHLEAAKAEDKDGLLPIHYACKNTGEEIKKIFIDALLTANPESA